jgi:hypothetical protein
VFWGVQVPDAAARNAGAGVTGVQIGVNFVPTLQLALRLQPELRRVYVVANSPIPRPRPPRATSWTGFQA